MAEVREQTTLNEGTIINSCQKCGQSCIVKPNEMKLYGQGDSVGYAVKCDRCHWNNLVQYARNYSIQNPAKAEEEK